MEKQYEIAKLMHVQYESYSLKVGWKTQKKCQTLFDELPPANKEVMLWVAGSILAEIKKKIIEKSTFESGVSSNGWYQIYKDDLDSIL